MRTPEDFVHSHFHTDKIVLTQAQLATLLIQYAKEFYNHYGEESWEKCVHIMNRTYQDLMPDEIFDYHPEFKKK